MAIRPRAGDAGTAKYGFARRVDMIIRLASAALMCGVLAACATNGGAGADDSLSLTPSTDHTRLAMYEIDKWSALSDKVMIVHSSTGERFRAEFFGVCPGLRMTEAMAFEQSGTTGLDRYGGVLLSDGTRCRFRSFERIGFAPIEGAEDKPVDQETFAP
jgi:hypothetical protein